MRRALILAVSTCLLSVAANVGAAAAAPIGLSSMTKADIYTVAGTGPSNPGDTGDGGPATNATLHGPNGSVVDAYGNLLIADSSNNVVRLVADESCSSASTCPYGLTSMTVGHIYLVAGDGSPGTVNNVGDGGPAISAELNFPSDVGIDGAGNLLIADYSNHRIRLVANESCPSACPYGLSSMTVGDIYTIAGDGLYGASTNGAPATSTGLKFPSQAIVDSAGDVLIANYGGGEVEMVAEHSCSGNCPYELSSMTVGDIYTIAGNGTPGYLGDGAAATSAELDEPSGIALDGAGNLLIADSGNNAVRVAAGETCTGDCPYGLFAMTSGDIYTVAGAGPSNSGYTGDGGPALSAELNQPNGVVLDTYGNVIIMDGGNNVVRLLAQESCSSASTCPYGLTSMTAGDIYTVAGDASAPAGYSGDGGSATQATMDTPASVAIDQYNDLLISDFSNNAIRLVSAETCSSSCALPSGGSSGGGSSGGGSSGGGSSGGGSSGGGSSGGGSSGGGASGSSGAGGSSSGGATTSGGSSATGGSHSTTTTSARVRLSVTADGVEQGSRTSLSCTATVTIASCRVLLKADDRLIGSAVATGRGSHSLTVAIQLNSVGRTLLDGTTGYVRATEEVTATTTAGQRLSGRFATSLVQRRETVTTAPGSFVPESATLTSTGTSFVANLARAIKRAERVMSTGYTANLGLGDTGFAQTLGMARAQAVVALLRHDGVTARYFTATRAASHPIAANTTATGQAQNRRVQLTIVFAPITRTLFADTR